MTRNRTGLLLGTLTILTACGIIQSQQTADEAPKKLNPIKVPLSPQEAVKFFKLESGLRIELVAAEPQIESPVAMAFDEDGRLFVVEMRDYPNGPGKGKPPEGRIRLLEDRDGDGFYETSTIFADNLLFANGLLPWRGGLIVTAAPHILHLKKSADGKLARTVLYEGFAAQNPQLRVSHPNLGIDNWIYVANGLRGGKVIRAEGRPGKREPINLSGMDFRFDLVHDREEAISGMGQFGNTFDDWGRRFVCDNRHHLRHVVMDNRYLKRNPFLAAPELVEDISVLGDGPLSSGGKIYPISSNWTTSSLHEGRFTAACGVFVYRGGLLAGNLRGSVFTCDPTGNLVHREIMKQHGASFTSKPKQTGVEFLASPDDWFRPVFLTSGPDGALYVVDMYRAVIEHPEFMPPELQKRPDLTLGKNKGRIWRIVPENHVTKTVKPMLSQADNSRLIELLAHPDAWWRTTAQRLLLERQDKETIKPLRNVVIGSKSHLARLHAAWLLDSLQGLDELLLLEILNNDHPRVREHGIRLGEKMLAQSPALQRKIKFLAEDGDPHVRFQAALSLGQWDDDSILIVFRDMLHGQESDRWTRLAIASSVYRPGHAGKLLASLFSAGKPDPARLALMQELAALVGARQEADEIAGVLAPLFLMPRQGALQWEMAVMAGLADGMGRRGSQLSAFLNKLPSSRKELPDSLKKFFEAIVNLAGNADAKAGDRLPAIRLLAHASWSQAGSVLTKLVNDDGPQEMRLAAVRSLAAHAQPEASKALMKSWRSYTPPVRREVSEAMLRQPDRILFLLDEVEAGRVKPDDIDVARSRQLLAHARADIRERARKLLQENLPAERKLVLERYRTALTLKGDGEKGREVFKKNCATCHKVGGIGIDVGPDIADTRTKTIDALLVDILNPNQAIDNNYINYLVTTKSGKSLTGVIAAENAASITLRRAEGQADVVLRQDIEELQSTGVSLMPEGLEKTISVTEMADLLSYLKNWRYLGGKVPLGK